MRMSILPLLLVVGVAFSKHISSHGNRTTLQPITTPSEARRICAALCMSGLGGEPCSESCLDILPRGLPLQFPNRSRVISTTTRRDACPILCKNQLGYPLCQCDYSSQRIDPTFRVDYDQICSYFCLNYNVKIHGCQTCQVYKNTKLADVGEYKQDSTRNDIDWEEWCRQQCAIGEGGIACNCDILPMVADDNSA